MTSRATQAGLRMRTLMNLWMKSAERNSSANKELPVARTKAMNNRNAHAADAVVVAGEAAGDDLTQLGAKRAPVHARRGATRARTPERNDSDDRFPEDEFEDDLDVDEEIGAIGADDEDDDGDGDEVLTGAGQLAAGRRCSALFPRGMKRSGLLSIQICKAGRNVRGRRDLDRARMVGAVVEEGGVEDRNRLRIARECVKNAMVFRRLVVLICRSYRQLCWNADKVVY